MMVDFGKQRDEIELESFKTSLDLISKNGHAGLWVVSLLSFYKSSV